MDEREPVISFWGEFRFLSNFAPVEVVFDGDTYPSVEHAYQAAKTTRGAARRRIRACETPGQANKAMDGVPVREGWTDEFRVEVMRQLLVQKFTREPYRSQLIATAGRFLVEGNSWGDRFWGMCDDEGLNHLGRLLMEIRADLQGITVSGGDLDELLLAEWELADSDHRAH